VSYSLAKASELPASTTVLALPSPTAEVPSNGTVLWCPMWKRGYGGSGLHRRGFPAHRRYLYRCRNNIFINFSIEGSPCSCDYWNCKEKAEFGLRIGSIAGRYCPKHTKDILTWAREAFMVHKNHAPDREEQV
jgi:hypothetical protein